MPLRSDSHTIPVYIIAQSYGFIDDGGRPRNRQRPPEGGQATSQAVGNSTGDEESSLNIICGILTGSEDVDMS
ncbi:hypothetical protein PCANC_05822 [Puccinia coronata f. sp. avenae]|uniref:Uncharacterized protein n=1 Tax=Puccinia coronata f. sp. avenae TaxID=200324 RepID=A0A2N5V5L1_9BASI|nr:hypothetical protein PCASD_03993 [Puccinia coronata f. sp. avenae]PLW53095.1 hypothetical protein PCANC_05822 [Puccinia coronata f. sp. avenae]